MVWIGHGVPNDGDLNCLVILKNVLVGIYLFSFLGHVVNVCLVLQFPRNCTISVTTRDVWEIWLYYILTNILALWSFYGSSSNKPARSPSFLLMLVHTSLLKMCSLMIFMSAWVKVIVIAMFCRALSDDLNLIYSLAPNLSSNFSMKISHQRQESFFLSWNLHHLLII